MQTPDCCAHEIKAEPSPRNHCFILQAACQNNDGRTWGIERLGLPLFRMQRLRQFVCQPLDQV